ncbi:MAG: hypothetical protein IJU37_00110 [Desulfovibrio sp.]|nr:hypothetical protein [Desulfovibrio sp.]
MRWYGIDDITHGDMATFTATLKDMGLESGLDGLFWLPVPANMLSAIQTKHKESCGPHVMGLEVEENSLRLELLVRARGRLRCDCIGYASTELRNHMIGWLENLLRELRIDAV